MKMGNKRGCSSSLLLFLLTGGGLALTGAFMVPVKLMTRAGTGLPTTAPRTAGTDSSSNEFAPESVDRSTKKRKDVADIVRDAVFDASDSIADAVDKMPDFMANTNKTLLKIGDMVNDIDDRYFSKYLSFETTLTYKDTLAAAATTIENLVDKGVKAAGSVGNPKSDDDDDGHDDEEDKTERAKKLVSSAVAEASKTASAVEEGISTSAKAAVDNVGKAATEAKSTVTSAEGQAKKPVEPKTAKIAPAGSGTGDLDRPKEVEEVMTEIQRKAVEYYKSSPSNTADGAPDGGVTPLPEAVQALEEDLESLLEESEFSPRKLKKARKAKLVETLTAMEASFPEDANPVDDPSLSGQWTLVYSSSSRLLGRALRGVLAGLFKTSDRRQIIDTKACKVLNACRTRLRMTPWGLPIAKKGHYRPISDRKVEVVMPETKKGLLRRLLPNFRHGKAEVTLTYLSRQWRICRVGGATLAFRKVDSGS